MAVCLQETKIPSSSIEQRDEYVFVFSTSETDGTEHHGVGSCYNRRVEKYRNHYLQHSSHIAEIEINMHGNPLVILSLYMPHDASNEIKRHNMPHAAWGKMFKRTRDISHNKAVVVLGNSNAAIHARKIGEEECLGPHIWGKGMVFLREEGLLPENMNRSLLIDQLKEHDMRCMNTYVFQKLNNKKATYRHMWARGVQGPRDTDRYSELDLCLVFRRWENSIKSVESDSLTNVITDHLALNVNLQKLKALVEAEHGN